MYSYEFFNSFTLIALSKSTELQEVKFEDETANQLKLKQHLVIGHMVIGHMELGKKGTRNITAFRGAFKLDVGPPKRIHSGIQMEP